MPNYADIFEKKINLHLLKLTIHPLECGYNKNEKECLLGREAVKNKQVKRSREF